MRHGSESFFIVGEGLIATEVGGRKGTEPDPVNVSDDTPAPPAPQLLAAAEAPPFRFIPRARRARR